MALGFGSAFGISQSVRVLPQKIVNSGRSFFIATINEGVKLAKSK